MGYASTLEYVKAAAAAVLHQTGLLPHINAGLFRDHGAVVLLCACWQIVFDGACYGPGPSFCSTLQLISLAAPTDAVWH